MKIDFTQVRVSSYDVNLYYMKNIPKMQNLQDADCSGRTLATLLIAWVTAAMVASILLQWEYMWIVLAILTLLFLLFCGYTGYKMKKTHARMLLEQQRRAAIRTVSSITAINRRQVLDDLYRINYFLRYISCKPCTCLTNV